MSEETPNESEMLKEIRALREEIAELNDQGLLRMHSSWTRFILSNFVRGLTIGLGSVIGATLLVYILIQFLSRIDFIPVFGQWATEIVTIMNNSGSMNGF